MVSRRYNQTTPQLVCASKNDVTVQKRAALRHRYDRAGDGDAEMVVGVMNGDNDTL
jgi:hypothetical protein